ncbi:MAG TPA: choice-of-anchor I family protein [Anaerovoracaceae bacterium]|nr:choice-of-anchor I family protein [Anaerovoracaceae bacterium]
MNRARKSIISWVLAVVMVFGLLPAIPGGITVADAAAPDPEAGDIVILYTNDVHCGVDRVSSGGIVTNIGYAGVAAYKKQMEAIDGVYVVLADAGDAVQGAAIGAMSQGSYITDIIYHVGYDVFVPGNHEFDYGMARMQELMGSLTDHDVNVISSNFTDLRPEPDALVYEPYTIVTYDAGGVDKKVAFVGITTPESFTKSTPAYFQDGSGHYIYGFKEGNPGPNQGQELYDSVQEAVDDAVADGADYVVAVGHLGVDEQSSPWRSTDVIAHTSGIDAFIDGHSHTVEPGTYVENEDGNDVLLTQTGTKLANLGRMIIKPSGTISTSLISNYAQQDPETLSFINAIEAEYSADLAEVVGHTNVALTVNDPTTGSRIVRSRESNLGDLCADAYRYVLGNGREGAESGPADVAFVNGGGVRANINAGDITFGEVIDVHPFNNVGCVVEATGQEILDALEMGSRVAPGENGGFLQVSGLTYTIDTAVPSSVVLDSHGLFDHVAGVRRVKGVTIGGQPISPSAIYTVASHDYMLRNAGDGFSMFQDNNVVVQPTIVDNQILIRYIDESLGGTVGSEYSNPYGQGRINIPARETQTAGFADSAAALGIRELGRYSNGEADNEAEGGVQEIVTYNSVNGFAYSVNGKEGILTAIDLNNQLVDGNLGVIRLEGDDIDVSGSGIVTGFDYGDMTSVAVSPDGTKLAVALQAQEYDDPGRVAIFTCNEDGSLNFVRAYETGIQPDMVVFADNNTVLTADEGEPREGYPSPDADPKGSVTVVDLTAGTATVADFTAYDQSAERAALVSPGGVVLKIGADPSRDLEPEYIALAGDKAYITLQEANAVAVLDLASKTFTGIYSTGVQDYCKIAIDLDNTSDPEDGGGQYTPRYYEDTYGLRMPDGITAYQAGGKTYILTANEGDSRDWPGYSNENDEVKLTATDDTETTKKLRILTTDYDGQPGLSDGTKNYLFGGRSFSMFEVGANGLTLAYDSGSQFESRTAAYLPDYFNSSNDNVTKDDRSNKKGPEPEAVTIGTVGGRTYAFIALERIGGVMAYDITDPKKVSFTNYINSRDFENVDGDGIGLDDSPEGLKFIPAIESPTGGNLLLSAFEVSGDVAAYGLTSKTAAAKPLKLAAISDTHLYDSETLGATGSALIAYLNSDRKMLLESEMILDESIRRILASDADYVLVSGDLTKDGEKVNHELLAEKLAVFERYGKQVFVINGNHDLSNQHALYYNGANTSPADTVNRVDFKDIYNDFGYSQALSQDPNSLSYSVDLDGGYRLIAMDACEYNNDAGTGREQHTGGRFSDATFNWVLGQIESAIRAGRRPIGIMHHGLVSHTAVEPVFFPEYLVDDYKTVSQRLADAGMGLVFTGHHHAQDATVTQTAAGKKLYDMQTGALVTAPSPIRYVTVSGSAVDYTSTPITNAVGIPDFGNFAQGYLLQGLAGQVPGMLMAANPTLTTAAALAAANTPLPTYGNTLAAFLAECMAKYYAGGETPTPAAISGTISFLQNFTLGDAGTNQLYQLLGNAAWALANDTTGNLRQDQPAAMIDTVPDNNGSITLSALPTYEDGDDDNDGGGGGGGGGTNVPPVPPATKSQSLEIPANFLSNPSAGGTMTLRSDIGNITIPANMLQGVVNAEGKKAEILIGEGDRSNLPDEVGDRPVISLSLLLDGTQADWDNPDAPVTVSIPYTPTAEERANPESIVIWYIDGSGDAVCVPNGRYDPATGTVTVNITHFSDYAVAYNKTSFSDVSAGVWYNKAVSFIAARDITTGTGGGSFSPDAKLTRGQFLVMLMRAYEIAPDRNTASNFSDAGNTYYTGYLAAAKRLGISDGVGNNLFAPEKEITRQEMFTLLYNALNEIDKLPAGNAGKSLSSFTDAGQIAAWANDAMTALVETGVIAGSDGKLTPAGTTSRAEMSQVLYNLLAE